MRLGTERRVLHACVAALLLLAGAASASSTPRFIDADGAGSRTPVLHAIGAAESSGTLVASVSRRWASGTTEGRRGPIVDPLAFLLALFALAVTGAVWCRRLGDNSLLRRSLTLRPADPARAPPVSAR